MERENVSDWLELPEEGVCSRLTRVVLACVEGKKIGS